MKDLLIFDTNELTGKSNDYLKDLARDNAQLLINQIFKGAGLETEGIFKAFYKQEPMVF